MPSPAVVAGIVYTSAILPLFILIVLTVSGKNKKWWWKVYLLTFLLCAVGWEIWFTFGIIDGQSVDIRRNPELNRLIPQQINWVLNSLADSGIGLTGLFLAWFFTGRDPDFMLKNTSKVFMILTIFFLLQNLIVELFIYQGQLAAGLKLSWAPLSPFGSVWNPILFSIGEKSVHLQPQMPWIIMTPLLYSYARKLAGAER
jgi:hypothetical protein